MLQIRDIRKKYVTGDLVQTALDGVSLTLRDNEFVAILGPSGSGKTTLLNVIGGLDRYDSGDLIINGISTRKYSDRDWDSYRNHTIGFVFQSYNLIPHQTVLANVELALTISGISRSERRKRATQALESVGLGDQLHKRPNQMSGGQMQRVAIARALVNNPDILLADEPTGALDSETSVQIMDLLKEVAKDRLVVMVTHNPELAYEYANRIVRVKDGRIVDDSNPFDVVLREQVTPRHKNMGRSSMSFMTALALSFNNLKTKLARTLLTAFAGSIGIIGIALILSLSTGFQIYIDKIQEDTLSNYPLSIQTETADMTSMMAAMGTVMTHGQDLEGEIVVEQPMISQMFAQIGTNDLGAFKAYLEENYSEVTHAVNDIKYSYGVKPLLFAANSPYGNLQVNPGTLFGQLTGSNAMSAYMDTDVFQEMAGNLEMLDSQYDVIRGRWPENYREMIVVLTNPHQLSDYMAYTIGLKDPEELTAMLSQVMQGKELPPPGEAMQWTYEDLLNLEFVLVPASAKYRYNEEFGVWEDMSGDKIFMDNLIRNGEILKVVGIVCPKPGVSATTLPAGIAYTAELTQYVIEKAGASKIVNSQLENPNIDVFTGREFGAEKDGESLLSFEDLITIDEEAISSAFGMNISTSSLLKLVGEYIAQIYESSKQDRAPAQAAFTETLTKLATDMLETYVKANADKNGQAEISLDDVSGIVDEYLAGSKAKSLIQPMATEYRLTVQTFINVYKPLMIGLVSGHVAEELAENMTAETMSIHSEAPGIYHMEGQNSEPTTEETEPLEPTTEETEPTTEETEPTTEETEPTTEETEPTTEETEPTTEETEPTTEETEPTTEETEPTTEETEPTIEETEPTTEETEPTTEETEPTTEETEPTTEETEPTTEETEPTTEETEPTTEETEPTTEETEPTTEETEPTTEETEPTTEETEPTTEETEPTTEETEPTTEETEPTTEETEPTTEETEPTEEIKYTATISMEEIDTLVSDYVESPLVTGAAALMGSSMTQSVVRQKMLEQLSGVENLLMNYIGNSFYVDEEKLAAAFQFELDEEELLRLMEAMSPSREEATALSNLQSLGYADPDQPTAMAIYMTDFAGKEDFLAFLDGYNVKMESEGREEQLISYTDITGIMMSSVRTIIDSVSYVLIAFVAVSLIVSSIMIGIITYISVMERTKEIGVLRAIGASRRNISQVFNAETFIIGLCSGLIGVGVTMLLNVPINQIIHHLTNNLEINAQLPASSAVILVLLSMGLTLLGGLIPAKQAAKKDPVIALRSE